MRQLWISSIIFLSFLLISCQPHQETVPIKERQVDVIEHDDITASPIKLGEALNVTWRIQNQLSDIFNFAHYYYGEGIEPVSTETFQDMQQRLSNYVTTHFLEQELNTTIKQYCYFGCGVLFYPLDINDKTTVLTETAADRFTISTSYEPSIYMDGGTQHLTYIKENNVWKMDARVFEKQAEQLSDVNRTLGDPSTNPAKINPIIDAFHARVSTLQEPVFADVVFVSADELDTNQSYDAFLEELATELRQMDKTFNDNQQVWEAMRAHAVERARTESEPSVHITLYKKMTLARIHSLISRYHTY